MSVDTPDVAPRRRRVPLWLRIIIIAIVSVGVLYLLFFHVFPYVERIFENPIIEEAFAPRG